MCEVASFKNFENSLTTVKVMTKTKVDPFYLGHDVERSSTDGISMTNAPYCLLTLKHMTSLSVLQNTENTCY